MAQGYGLTVGVVDKASAPLNAINKRLAALRAPADAFAKSLSKFSDVSGINSMGSSLQTLTGHARSAAQSIGSIVPGLTALTGAGVVAGLAQLINRMGAFGTETGNAAYRLRMSADTLHAWQGAARLGGSSAEAMASGLQTLNDTMQDAVSGRNTEALRLFQALHINIQEAALQGKRAEEVFPALADAISRVRDPTQQARIATTALGSAGIALLPMLRQGGQAFRQLAEDARRYGVTNEAGTQQAARFRMEQQRVGLAMEGLGLTISERLFPVITPMLNGLAEWIARNREWIATGITDAIKSFAEWVKGIDFTGILQGTRDFITRVNEIIQSIGGWKTALEVLFGFMAARFAITMIAPFVTLAGAITTATLGIGGLGIAITRLTMSPAFLALSTLVAGFLAWKRLGEMVREDPAGVARRRENYRGNGARRIEGWDDPQADMGPGGTGLYSMSQRLAMALGTMIRPERVTGLLPGHARRAAQDDAGDPGPSRPGAGPDAVGPRHVDAYNHFRSLGWSEAAAAGIVGNLHHESGARHDGPWGDGGNSGGIAQWDATRRAAFEAWSGTPFRQSTRRQQLDYIHYELTQGNDRGARRAGELLRNATDAMQAGRDFSINYERPAGRMGEALSRGRTAENMLPALREGANAPALPVAPLRTQQGAPGATAAAGAPGAASGQIAITIDNNTGNRVSARATGDALTGAPLVRNAMPLGAAP